MKKTVAWLLLAAVLFCGVGFAEETSTPDSLITFRGASFVEDPIGVQSGQTLTVASVTELSGYFSTDLWGNNTADLDVRGLLHGYSTVAWLRSSEMMFNGMAVAAVDVTADAEGNRTYTFTLMNDLVYSDGTPITAKDYVFSLLLCASSQVAQLGGQARGIEHFVGYEDYTTGKTHGISGIRLLGDDSFSLEVDAVYLPYFYGLSMVEVTPYPMHIIAPGCDILDDGTGAYIGMGTGTVAAANAQGYTPGVLSVEMLAATMLDPEDGYVFNPRVTSGPYTLESFDTETKVATFAINERYRGNYEGQKPHIGRIVYRPIRNEDMRDALTSGEVDLINKVVDGETVTGLLQLTARADADYSMQGYPRSGLAYLGLACEEGVTADVAVRRAIAMCVDKDALVSDISPYALSVNGYYGMGQWFLNYTADADPDLGRAEIRVSDFVQTLAVAYNVEAAKAELQAAGWAYDENGGAYTQGTRYRREADGTLTPLVIRWAKSNDTETTNRIEAHIVGPFAEAGIDLQITEMPFAQMLRHFYRIEPRTYDMFFLASNFLDVFDPYFDYNTADIYQGTVNTSGLRDEHLIELARDVRSTPSTETYEYVSKWMAFQSYWVEVMPLVPLYSNVYFDFFSNDLQGYDVTVSTTWSYAIPYAWLGDAAEGGSGEGAQGEVIIEDGI